MKELIWQYRYVIVVILGFAFFAILDFAKFKELVYQAMLVAKSKAKDLILTSGEEQENFVVEKVYILMPARLKAFITKELLRSIVRKWYKKAKDYLDDGQVNNSIH